MLEEQTTTESDITQGIYELGYHIVPTVSKDDIAQHVSAVKALIATNNGSLIAEEAPAKLQLAYTMAKGRRGTRDKYDTAYFGWVKCEIDTEALTALTEALDQKAEILRYLLIQTVRGDTRAAKKIVATKSDTPQPRVVGTPPAKPVVRKEEKPAQPVSEGELDKAIEELVVD